MQLSARFAQSAEQRFEIFVFLDQFLDSVFTENPCNYCLRSSYMDFFKFLKNICGFHPRCCFTYVKMEIKPFKHSVLQPPQWTYLPDNRVLASPAVRDKYPIYPAIRYSSAGCARLADGTKSRFYGQGLFHPDTS